MKKKIKKVADRTLGVPMRSLLRNCVNPLFRMMFKVTIVGADQAASCKDGAIVVSNHVSRLDGPFLMNEAWPYARVWPTAWCKEYESQRFLMWVFSTVSLGSPSHFSALERAHRKEKAMEIMDRIVRAGRHILIFAEGGINDGSRVTVKPHLTGVHDLIKSNPDKPVLMVRISGLEKSIFGKVKQPWHKRLSLRRIPVTITLERFNSVALYGGPPGINQRIEQYFNYGIPLATTPKGSAL